MGETRKDALRLDFYCKLKLEFHGTKVTSDAGLLAYRQLDETLNLTSTIDSELRDIRTGKRGTAEQWIKEGKYALNWTRLSCHDLVDNQVRLQLFSLAYNLGNFLSRLALPRSVKQWSLRTLRDKLVKIGAKVIRHSRYVIFQMAEVAVPRAMFREILNRIRQLRFLTIPSGLG